MLLCNAGIAASHLVVRCPEDEWQRIIDTNLEGTYRTMTTAAARMMTEGGSILVIGSYAGFAWDERARGLCGLQGWADRARANKAAREWGRTISGLISCVRGGSNGLAGDAYPSADDVQGMCWGVSPTWMR